MFIDTHAHIYSKEFDTDVAEVIQRAKEANIEKIVLPDIDSLVRADMLKLADSYPDFLYPCIGLHPTSVNENFRQELVLLDEALSSRKFWAIGETGIDLYWDKSYKEQQIEALRYQLDLSLKYNLPIILHARDSIKEIFDVLEEYKTKDIKGVLHCFPGDLAEAKKAIDYGLFLGIGGVSTFKNTHLREVIKEIDLKNIVLETDSPYLAPVPFRGKRNESAYVVQIADMLSGIYCMDIEKIGEITSNNARRLFNF